MTFVFLCTNHRPCIFIHVQPDISEYDSFVSAEIPDPQTQPVLHEIITRSMLHGFCNADSPCWRQGRCSKHFPVDFCAATETSANGMRVNHRRRSPEDGGRTFVRGDYTYTNAHVVPYSPYLCLRYGTHINVVICTSTGWIKYL